MDKTLSDKRLKNKIKDNKLEVGDLVYPEKDVKEFIKDLNKISYINADGRRVINVSDLNERAGKKLTGKPVNLGRGCYET